MTKGIVGRIRSLVAGFAWRRKVQPPPPALQDNRGRAASPVATDSSSVLCPRCLARLIQESGPLDGTVPIACPECQRLVPGLYLVESQRTPATPVTIVGLRGHGKTVYLSSLYMELDRAARRWERFAYRPLDEGALAILKQHRDGLERGQLPKATQRALLEPLMLKLIGLPISFSGKRDTQLVLFDVSGEAFQSVADITTFAGYLARSKVLVWLVSPSDLQSAHELEEFVPRYKQAFIDLERTRTRQHLIVVVTKSDRFVDSPGFPAAAKALLENERNELSLFEDRVGLGELSRGMRDWIRREHGQHNLTNLLDHEFESVTYLPVSALGSDPGGRPEMDAVYPIGVFLPLFYAVDLATSASGPSASGDIR